MTNNFFDQDFFVTLTLTYSMTTWRKKQLQPIQTPDKKLIKPR